MMGLVARMQAEGSGELGRDVFSFCLSLGANWQCQPETTKFLNEPSVYRVSDA